MPRPRPFIGPRPSPTGLPVLTAAFAQGPGVTQHQNTSNHPAAVPDMTKARTVSGTVSAVDIGYPVKWSGDLCRSFADANAADCAATTTHSSISRYRLVLWPSVAVAGVLLVFCYLIVPSVGAMLYSEHIGTRLAIGWTMGTLVSAMGVYLSLQIDLPTGATIVCTFALVLLAMAALRPFIQKRIGVPDAAVLEASERNAG